MISARSRPTCCDIRISRSARWTHVTWPRWSVTSALAAVVRPYQINRGGPIIMLQIENEYGSYPPGHDRKYLERLCAIWREEKLEVPFFTADGPDEAHVSTGMVPGGAIGMDTATADAHWALAKRLAPTCRPSAAKRIPAG